MILYSLHISHSRDLKYWDEDSLCFYSFLIVFKDHDCVVWHRCATVVTRKIFWQSLTGFNQNNKVHAKSSVLNCCTSNTTGVITGQTTILLHQCVFSEKRSYQCSNIFQLWHCLITYIAENWLFMDFDWYISTIDDAWIVLGRESK